MVSLATQELHTHTKLSTAKVLTGKGQVVELMGTCLEK